MLVLIHVAFALTSIFVASWALLRPSQPKLKFSYGLVGLTLASGTYLVVSAHSALLPACTSGLIYLGIVGVALAVAQYRLHHID